MKRSGFLHSCPIVFTIILVSFLMGCTKKDPDPVPLPSVPTVQTFAVENITALSAQGGGTCSGNRAGILQKGLCWSGEPNPTTGSSTLPCGSGEGEFTGALTGLAPNTEYHVRAYATNSAGTAYGNEFTFTTLENTYYIGASYGGGTIFYLDSTGQHGLVAANTDQGKAEWGCEGVPVPGTLAAIGSGQANTTAILQKCSTVTAAQNCDALVLNGYSDWFLPSKDELNEMYKLKTVIGGFLNTAYWSSTEYKSEAPYGKLAWLQWFDDGDQFYSLKSNQVAIRAIRSF